MGAYKAAELRQIGGNVPKRTSEQIFMDTLAYMAGDPPANVSSRAIKDALGWQDGRFANVRRGLVDAGLIKGVLVDEI